MTMHKNYKTRWLPALVLMVGTSAMADNPLVIPGAEPSFPDVCFQPLGDTMYAFGGTDVQPQLKKGEKDRFMMMYWRCFSSKDLVNWTYESEVHPTDTYIGESDQCWASHAVFKNNQWYWYLSNWNHDTAVVVAETTKGPWKDPLGKPLLKEDMTPTHEYDNCVFIDDDGRAYIVFGINRRGGYHIAELNDDLVSLKTKPAKLPNDLEKAGDAPYLHKANGKYYLSSRAEYAVADTVKGPYKMIGTHEAGGHGGHFVFNNQTYINYTSRRPGTRQRYRFVALVYSHYRADGTIVTKEKEIEEYGVGRYNAEWNRIETEWFFAMPAGPKKSETASGGFEISNLKKGDWLRFPNIGNCPKQPVLELTYSCANANGGILSVRADGETGEEIGKAEFKPTGSWTAYKTVSIPLRPGDAARSIAFVVDGSPGEELIRIDAFNVKK